MTGWQQLVVSGTWGGLVALERRAFLQAMFSRPLVAATAMGLLLDDLPSGLYVGLVLELYFLGSASLGAALPDHDTLAATSTAAAAVGLIRTSGGGSTEALWALSILLFIGTGRLGRVLERRLEGYSTRVARRALELADLGQLRRSVRYNLLGMWPHFVVFGAVTAACGGLGLLLGPWVSRIPLEGMRGLAWAYPSLVAVAAAIAARGSHARHGALYAGVVAVVVAAGALVVHRGGL